MLVPRTVTYSALVVFAALMFACTDATVVGGQADATVDVADAGDRSDVPGDGSACAVDGCVCDTDSQCASGRCVGNGDAMACASPCRPDGDECTEGFACIAAEYDGGTAFFCLGGPDACTPNDELCDGGDNDCDDSVDEDFDLSSDLSNCGECGQACDGDNARLRCNEGVCELFSCVPGWVDCDGDLANGCETRASGVDACDACTAAGNEVGDPCGTCDSGRWDCSDTGAFFCDGDRGPDALNLCGGCAELAAVPGDVCGACERDAWVCAEDGDSVVCSGESFGNACGGCAELEVVLGDACGTCGAWSCNAAAPDMPLCIEGRPNACGGCGSLVGVPGEGCGRCGVFECDDDAPGSVTCVEGRMNACGGCGPLDEELGARCGECGEFVCDDEVDGEVVCLEGRPNACGGCAPLGVTLGDACGECGAWACADDGSGRPVCEGEAGLNECGGCGELSHTLGRACGRCDLDEYICRDGDAVCSGDSVVNVCGGCERLEESPGTPCSRSGCSSPLAVRACVDESTVECRCDRDVCGNGLLEADEQCDDGGGEADDGCSPECTLEAIGDGEGSCASPFALPLDSVSEWNLCRYDDAVAVRPGSGCTLASVGPDVVFTIDLERESRVLIEAFDEAEVTDVDVVVAVASSCGAVVEPQVCDDGVACDDAESSDGCVDGEQPRQARVDRVLSAGRWFVVVETRRSTRGDTEFACGAVRIEVRDDGERR